MAAMGGPSIATLPSLVVIQSLISLVNHGVVGEIPRVTMLRQQIRNFVPGSRGSITIVYQTSKDVEVRWFRKAEPNTLPFAELPDMLPTSGDSRYSNSSITAGNVVATSLIVNKVPNNMWPLKYTMLISISGMPLQYQMKVEIPSETRHRRDYLDGVRWIHRPPPAMWFHYKGQFQVSCSALLDAESQGYLDELRLYRTYADRRRRRDRDGHLISTSCGLIHKQRNNYEETSGQYVNKGSRRVRSHGYVRYHLMMRVKNATMDDEGMYTCALERKMDSIYVSSWVHQGDQPSKPVVELLPCEAHRFNQKRKMLHLQKGKETCFRCRGYSHPPSFVQVKKNGRPVKAKGGLLVDSHFNVPDGGLSEVTYTLLNPRYEDAGQYQCIAKNEKASSSIKFHITIMK